MRRFLAWAILVSVILMLIGFLVALTVVEPIMLAFWGAGVFGFAVFWALKEIEK